MVAEPNRAWIVSAKRADSRTSVAASWAGTAVRDAVRAAKSAALMTAPPAVTTSRLEADPRLAALPGIEQHEPLFILDQAVQDLATGRTVLTRRILPFSVAEGTSLETEPYPERAHLLSILREQHGELSTMLYIRAYLPYPDEAATLGMLDATPVLETIWLTSGLGGRILFAEIERASAEGIHYAYRSSNLT